MLGGSSPPKMGAGAGWTGSLGQTSARSEGCAGGAGHDSDAGEGAIKSTDVAYKDEVLIAEGGNVVCRLDFCKSDPVIPLPASSPLGVPTQPLGLAM